MRETRTGTMPHVKVTRRYRFSASHRLCSPLLDDARNREIYGKCNHPYGHGHDYVLDVSISGALDPQTGRLVPLGILDSLVENAVLGELRHRNLNTDVPEFRDLVPTTENLGKVIVARLAAAWRETFAGKPVQFEKVTIGETRNNIFEVVNEVRRGSSGQGAEIGELQEIR